MKSSPILWIDEETIFLKSVRRLLWEKGFENITIENNPEYIDGILQQKAFDLIMLDISMPGINGLELLEKITGDYPETPVIVVTAVENVKTAFTATRLGAYDYLIKPPDIDRLIISMNQALEKRLLQLERDYLRKKLQVETDGYPEFSGVITSSPLMYRIFDLIRIFAPTNETILITGETGTGKDVMARRIHELSPKKNKNFLAVNLASISPTLFESELFGHERGSFTGAQVTKTGFFEEAGDGSIFLDEIGELSKEHQGKLLRAIQYNEIFRIGSTKPYKFSCRIIAATNKNLLDEVEKGEFRADLYYRLNRGFVQLPPLRERPEDVLLLSHHFRNVGSSIYDKEIPGFSRRAVQQLTSYDFPGNVRELENIVLNACAKSIHGRPITGFDMPSSGSVKPAEKSLLKTGKDILTLEEMEAKYILKVFNDAGQNVSQAAYLLGLSERTMQRKLKSIRGKQR